MQEIKKYKNNAPPLDYVATFFGNRKDIDSVKIPKNVKKMYKSPTNNSSDEYTSKMHGAYCVRLEVGDDKASHLIATKRIDSEKEQIGVFLGKDYYIKQEEYDSLPDEHEQFIWVMEVNGSSIAPVEWDDGQERIWVVDGNPNHPESNIMAAMLNSHEGDVKQPNVVAYPVTSRDPTNKQTVIQYHMHPLVNRIDEGEELILDVSFAGLPLDSMSTHGSDVTLDSMSTQESDEPLQTGDVGSGVSSSSSIQESSDPLHTGHVHSGVVSSSTQPTTRSSGREGEMWSYQFSHFCPKIDNRILLLGMHCHAKKHTDYHRVKWMVDHLKLQVLTVSNADSYRTQEGHGNSDFSQAVELNPLEKDMPDLVALDYVWMERSKYFREKHRYGMNWFCGWNHATQTFEPDEKGKIEKCIDAGAGSFLIPNSKSDDPDICTHAMVQAWRKSTNTTMQVHPISPNQSFKLHPLVAASDMVNVEIAKNKTWSHTRAMHNELACYDESGEELKDTPAFWCCFHKDMEWPVIEHMLMVMCGQVQIAHPLGGCKLYADKEVSMRSFVDECSRKYHFCNNIDLDAHQKRLKTKDVKTFQCQYADESFQQCSNSVTLGVPYCPIHTLARFGVYYKKEDGKGWGIFAAHAFEKGDFIVPYPAECITEKEYISRYGIGAILDPIYCVDQTPGLITLTKGTKSKKRKRAGTQAQREDASKHYFDGAFIRGVGSFVNTGYSSNIAMSIANAEISKLSEEMQMQNLTRPACEQWPLWITASKKIEKDSEVLADYKATMRPTYETKKMPGIAERVPWVDPQYRHKDDGDENDPVLPQVTEMQNKRQTVWNNPDASPGEFEILKNDGSNAWIHQKYTRFWEGMHGDTDVWFMGCVPERMHMEWRYAFTDAHRIMNFLQNTNNEQFKIDLVVSENAEKFGCVFKRVVQNGELWYVDAKFAYVKKPLRVEPGVAFLWKLFQNDGLVYSEYDAKYLGSETELGSQLLQRMNMVSFQIYPAHMPVHMQQFGTNRRIPPLLRGIL